MPLILESRTRRVAASILIAAIVGTSAAACAGGVRGPLTPVPSPSDSASPSPSPSPSPSASPSEAPSPSPSPSPSASPSPTPAPAPPAAAGTPLGLGCLDLVSLDTMYQYDPNFSLLDSYSPAGPTATAVGNAGTACGWVQQSSGILIEYGVAQPAPGELNELRVSAGLAVGATGEVISGNTVQAFTATRWIVFVSPAFGSTDDARPLLDSVYAAIG